jgi:pimeloyl-ACP methyl ester carboxylesterase
MANFTSNGSSPWSTRNQDRVEINWDNFNRYWSGRIYDDEDLKAPWADIIPLYDYKYDPVKAAARVEAGIYRHEAHNWCFEHNMPGYDLKPELPGVRCPTLVTVGRTDWITPVSCAETIASLIPDSPPGDLREVRALAADGGGRQVPGGPARVHPRGARLNAGGDLVPG